jgi:hypothetical protein
VIEVYETVRWANLLLASTLTLLWLFRLGAFARAPWPSKLGRLTVFGWVSSTAYGTWEALEQAASPGLRVPTVTSVLLLSGYWIFEEWRQDRLWRLLPTDLRALLRDSQPVTPAGR